MDLVAVIRHKVHAEGVPIREIARELGLSRNTIRRYARAKKVPIDRMLSDRATPTRDAIAEAAAAIWQSRRSFTAGKQRLTATRLWELLRDAGHTASERTVRRLVAEFRSAEREVTVPLVYGAGEVAQVDFFEVWVELAGVRQKAWLFLMRLMHSGRDFAMLCAQQDATWFLAAHVAAFQHFAGVVAATAYDNLTAAVAKVLVGAPRVLRPRFMERITVTMQPLAGATRLLAMAGKDEVMRAILGPTTASHPRAAATLLEGLSLWHQQALSVVLCADVEVCSSATRMLDQLGFGTRTVHYDVEVAFLAQPRRGRRIQGFGNFGDLRQLCLEGVTP